MLHQLEQGGHVLFNRLPTASHAYTPAEWRGLRKATYRTDCNEEKQNAEFKEYIPQQCITSIKQIKLGCKNMFTLVTIETPENNKS